ncbi:MAG TPA: type I-E CRISPR-associated protein Cas7/Cse4/CasC [Anaerolineaceae bacterium]|nr:type I-E CRISPR-associated protein Cas7/Cse4/CasC [Anaerolineaceae bacterium]
MFIEVHILQNFAPSNLNRDDTGNPKDTEFGGVRRARISSQCIKRAIRTQPVFAEKTAVEPGVRTRWMNRLLAERFEKAGKSPEQAQAVADAIATQYSKLDKNHTSVLIYLSSQEVAAFASQALEKWDEILASLKDGKSPLIDAIAKELFKTIKDRTGAPDIALFGRMLAEKPELNLDAACQVAHAISTHRVSMDMDFYTAVDELTRDDEEGAGMMGVTGFNSACFYRYARLDWNLLVKNLGGDRELARCTVEAFLRAAISAVPTGKQNSFAAQNPPDFLLGVVRTDGESWSLANAFEKPVKPGREGGYLAPSLAALDGYWGRLETIYGGTGVNAAALTLEEDAPLENLKGALVANREEWIGHIIAGLE